MKTWNFLWAAVLFSVLPGRAQPDSQWLLRNSTAPPNADLYCVAFGNGVFVAAGAQGAALTSPDGIHWTGEGLGSTNPISSVAYGNGYFVAAGPSTESSQALFTSPDGYTWTQIAVPTGGLGFYSITYGPEGFVACGIYPGFAAYSLDGINWQVTDVTGGSPYPAFFGGGEYVVSGPELIYSPDGVNWTASATNYPIAAIAYGNGEFVGVGSSGAVNTTTLLDIWAAQDSGTSEALNGVAYGTNQFVAVGWSGTILTSPEGIHWFPRVSGTSDNLNAVAYGNGVFVAVGDSSTVLSSADGTNWVQAQSSSNSQDLSAVVRGANSFVALGGNGSMLISTSGNQWSTVSSGTNVQLTALGFGTNFVAIGQDVVATSPDGTKWSAHGSAVNGNAVVFFKNSYVVAGNNGTIYTSANAAVWTSRVSGASGNLYAIAYSSNQLVCVGAGSAALTSPDGIHWTTHAISPPAAGQHTNYLSVAYGGGLFVAVGGTSSPGNQQAIATSPDGTNWTLQTSAMPRYELYGVAYDALNKIFAAVGDGATILTSSDGTNWQAATSPNQSILQGVAAGLGGFVAVGLDGTILQTADTILPATLGLTVGQAGAGVGISLTGAPGQSYTLQASMDLANWVSLTNVVLSGSSTLLFDPSSTQYSQRFYRAATP